MKNQAHLLKVIIVLMALAVGLTLALWPKKTVNPNDVINENLKKQYEQNKNRANSIPADSVDYYYQRARAKLKK